MKMEIPVKEEFCPVIRSSKGTLPVRVSSGETHNTSFSFITDPTVSLRSNMQVTLSSSAAVSCVADTIIGVPPSSAPYRGLRVSLPENMNILLLQILLLATCCLTYDNLCKAKRFSHTVRYIDDLLTLNNTMFEGEICNIYPTELTLKKTTECTSRLSYLDISL